jgi:tetratricopeptide (TPR) repeat protein
MEIGSLLARARGLIDSGRHSEAVRVLVSAVHRRPDFPDLHNWLGLALSMSGEPLRAESHLKRAVELHPEYAEAHLNLAVLLFERGAYGVARTHLREFDRLVRAGGTAFPEAALDDLARRHGDLAARYRTFGWLEEAEAELHKAVRLRPAYGDLRLQLVRVLFERTKLDEAAMQIERLLQQLPDYQDAQVLLGRIEAARGNVEAARAAWMRVRDGGPAAVQARALLESLESEARAARGAAWPAARVARSGP